MSDWLEKSRIVATGLEKTIREKYPELIAENRPDGKGLQHALFMVGMILHSPLIDNEAKACRWLGWLQCIMAYENIISLNESKNINRGVA